MARGGAHESARNSPHDDNHPGGFRIKDDLAVHDRNALHTLRRAGGERDIRASELPARRQHVRAALRALADSRDLDDDRSAKRHRLVADIIDAYARHDENNQPSQPRSFARKQ